MKIIPNEALQKKIAEVAKRFNNAKEKAFLEAVEIIEGHVPLTLRLKSLGGENSEKVDLMKR